ncbi:MAG: ATP-dependent Clp protease adapter ClpS [Gammaproteobacteria bacterium CG11_big_fil_rev_8_21_14_0_20_46_22]|nr:MAG: ATP-dependent Clp protease adapter ClpS [Gammaproteobacteria bacterium CG12_big_fil_rev_8_21_14_0_65_46_12]PIR10799.1 MAG: ATP-dependent Clp protease adapter ClpS [Gammaproteobacteria bacterium CG11_big_fil_rev_8_21_14_0_20_46_22]
MTQSRQRQFEVECGILLAEAPQTKPPKMYQIVLFNDDFTPMDFVVEVLRIFFFKTKPKAEEIMLKIHTTGKAVCGIYTKNVAEMKISQVRRYARDHEHPLRCEMQPLDG